MMMSNKKDFAMKTVLITGANRGIGLAFVKQLATQNLMIIATCRSPEQADDLIALSNLHANIHIKKLDVNDDNSIELLASDLQDTPIDWLINNAGISGNDGVTVGNIERDNFLKVLETNAVSPIKLTDSLLPSLLESQDKLVVCISSRMGSISDNQRGRSYAYRTSKSALNCVMRSFAIDIAEKGVNVLLLHPGWVQTRMGGENGSLTPVESVRRMLEIIENHKDNAHAETLWSHDGSKIEW